MADGGDLGWAREDSSWWPVYVCDIKLLRRDDLFYLYKAHQKPLEQARRRKALLVFYLGTYEFSCKAKGDVVLWSSQEENCDKQDPSVSAQFSTAMAEAEVFHAQGIVPFLAPSDLDKRINPPPRPTNIAAGSLVWHSHSNKPWAPAYLFDPNHLSHKRCASKDIQEQLRLTQTKPQNYYVVYKFIDNCILVFKRGNARILPWGGADHSKLLLGVPRREDTVKDLQLALERLNEFLAEKQNQKKLTINSYHRVKVPWIRSSIPNHPSVDDESTEEEGEATDGTSERVPIHREPVAPQGTATNMAFASSRSIPAPSLRPAAPLVKPGDKSTQDASKPKNEKKRKPVEDVAGQKIYSKKTHAAARDNPVPQQPSCEFDLVAVPKPAYFQNGIAWARVNDQRWWPVFIYNQDQWNPEPSAPRLSYDIYSFGYHKMRSHEFGFAELRPWKCSDAPALHQSSHATICQDRVFEKEKYENAVAEADDFYAEYGMIDAHATVDNEIVRVATSHSKKQR